MSASVVFMPSPLLGPSVWDPVAREMAGRGWETVVGEVPVPVLTGDDVAAAFRAALPDDRDIILVAHSNAGAYIPELTVQRPVRAAVFVDALLPPSRGRVPLAPPALLDVLREWTDDEGLLPRWTDWWSETDVAALFPSSTSRVLVGREQQQIPLTYFEEMRAVPAGWDTTTGAYVAFGETYALEREDARRRRWPVRTLPQAGHLHQLVDPEQVSTVLGALLGELGFAPTRV